MDDASNGHWLPHDTLHNKILYTTNSPNQVKNSFQVENNCQLLPTSTVKMRLKTPQFNWQESRKSLQNTMTRTKLQPTSQSLQKLCQRLTGTSQLQEPQSHIFNLPQELLDEIVGYLPVLSQASFAVSCKSFYIRFQQVLQHPTLEYPQHLLRTNQPYIKRAIEKCDYTKLVRYLETSNWKFCPGCSKLHPHSTWRIPKRQRSYQLQFFSGQKFQTEIHTCPSNAERAREYQELESSLNCWFPIPPSSLQPSKRTCLPWAGMVNICPCLSMSYRHRDQMRNLLQSLEGKGHDGTEFFFENDFFRPSSGHPSPLIYHQCVKENDIVKAGIMTVFYAQEGYLIVQSDYHVCVVGGKLPVDVEPPFNCSKREKLRWFHRFMQFLDEHEVQSESKSRSKGLAVRMKPKEAPVSTTEFMVSLKRNLGKGKWPDTNWEDCRLVGREKK